MKKLFLFLAIAALSMSSCKKEPLDPVPFTISVECESCVIVFYSPDKKKTEAFAVVNETKQIDFNKFSVKHWRLISSGYWKVIFRNMTFSKYDPADYTHQVY